MGTGDDGYPHPCLYSGESQEQCDGIRLPATNRTWSVLDIISKFNWMNDFGTCE